MLVFLVVFILAAASYFVFSEYRKRTVEYSPTDEKITENINKQISKLDSDSDGLKDWEETLWKTDPNNPDTDGDGTEDNLEILANRNPLIAGPNDSLEKEIEEKEVNDDFLADLDLNQTDIFAKDFFSGYVALKQADLLGSEEEKMILQKITDQTFKTEPKVNLYSLDNLKITLDSGKDSLQKYSNTFIKILSEIPNLRDDNIILKEALDNDSPESLKEIESNVVFYRKVINSLAEMEVPFILQEKHLTLINLFAKFINTTEQLLLIFTDPLTALVGAKEYYEIFEKITIESIKIGELLANNGI